jgi:hypothetical protein
MAWYVPGSFLVGLVAAKSIERPALLLRERLFPDDRGRAVPAASLAPAVAASPETVGVA